jgi:hypothetical protein
VSEDILKDTLAIMKSIRKDHQEQKITNNKIAEVLGVSAGQVTQYFDETVLITFLGFVKLVEFVYLEHPEKQRKLIFKFLHLTERKENKRIAMEYAFMQGNLKLLGYLVKKEINSSYIKNKEFAYIYEMIYLRIKGKLKGKQLLEKLEDKKNKKNINSPEMKILVEILMMNAFNDLEEYDSMLKISENTLVSCSKLPKKSYLRSAYEYRVMDAHALAHLKKNNIDETRKITNEMLNVKGSEKKFPLFRAAAYYFLGQTYIFEDVNKSLMNLEKAIRSLKTAKINAENRNKVIQSTIDFVKIYWGIQLESISPSDPAERAYLEFKKGNCSKSISIIEKIKRKNGFLTPFQKFVLASATNDTSLHVESLVDYEKKGNKFYSKLPQMALGIDN